MDYILRKSTDNKHWWCMEPKGRFSLIWADRQFDEECSLLSDFRKEKKDWTADERDAIVEDMTKWLNANHPDKLFSET